MRFPTCSNLIFPGVSLNHQLRISPWIGTGTVCRLPPTAFWPPPLDPTAHADTKALASEPPLQLFA